MEEKSLFRQLLRASTVGLNLVFATFIGLGIGWLLDNKVFGGKTSPWLTIIFLVFGIIAGFRDLYRMAKEGGDENDKKGL